MSDRLPIAITLEDQIIEVRRELNLRRHVYSSAVSRGRMNARLSAWQIDAMTAVLHTLEGLRDAEAKGAHRDGEGGAPEG